MEGPEFMADLAVECFEQGSDDQYGQCVTELQHMVGSRKEVQELLRDAGLPVILLRKAAAAAAIGDQDQANRLRQRAESFEGAEGVRLILEEHRIYLGPSSQAPIPPSTRPAHGFAG